MSQNVSKCLTFHELGRFALSDGGEGKEEFSDFLDELRDELGSEVSSSMPAVQDEESLGEMFQEFQEGLKKQLGDEDFETHYNLGIAYKEMGLIDESIAEFQHAAKDPSRFLECCSLLGRCFIEKGMPQLAVQWYTRGLGAEGYGEEEMQNLRYELAILHEQLGDYSKAYEYYCELQEQNGSYRDVDEKIKTLAAQLGK